MTLALTEDELRAAVALRDQHTSLAAAARESGLSENAFRNRLARAAERGFTKRDPVMPGYVIKSVASQDEGGAWVKQTREPGEVFKLPDGHAIKGFSTLVDGDGRTIQQWIKTREDAPTQSVVDALKAAFQAYEGLAPLIPAPAVCDRDLLTVYPLPDLHIGMMAWGRETGEKYDLRIATARVREMAGDLIAQSRPSSRAVVLGLGDLFHMNDQRNATPKSGHVLDVDGRWPKVLEAGIRMMMDVVEMAAQKHERLTVRILPGNHDPDAAHAVTAALRVFYASNPRIEVDSDPSLHWFHRFGRVQFGATHGHTMKPEAMAMMLATDRREDWGATAHKHFFFGHIHHETAKEIGKVRVESFNTIAAKDAYAHGAGHRSGQALNALTFHRERGEVGRHRVNLDVESAATELRMAA